jgi:solute carrier family 13 (sodium-dependent dicarboxylate transporter), member 2/3/5
MIASTKQILLPLFFSVAIYFVLNSVMLGSYASFIALVIFLVVLWTNEALPLGVVSLLPLILFPAFDLMSLNSVAPNYAKSIIFLFLGGFFLAIAVEKTGLHITIVNRLLKLFPLSIRGILYALFITSALLSGILSNTTTTLLLVPVVLALSDARALRIRFLLAIAYGASVGGVLTPIGTAPNMLYLGFMESHGLAYPTFMSWIGMLSPLVLLMILILPFILSIGVDHRHLHTLKTHHNSFDVAQKKVAILITIMGVLLFLNAPIEPYYSGLGLNDKLILLCFGLLMFLPELKILEWEDSKKVPYEIIFLFGAGFSIAATMQSIGLASEVAGMLSYFANVELWMLLLVVSLLVIFATEITSNTALTSLMLPILFAFGTQSDLDVTLIMMVATISASFAFMLPIATPPNAIIMSSGVIKIKDMTRFGFIFNILGTILIVIIALWVW